MALAPGATIIANMLTLLGAADPGSSMTIQLAGYGSQVPRVAGSGLLVRTRPIPLIAPGSGLIQETIWNNAVITPQGTYYTMTFSDEAGNVIQLNAYQFLQDGSYDLSNTPIYNPFPPLPPPPADAVLKNPPGGTTQTVAGALRATFLMELNEPVIVNPATALFDGSQGNSFKISLTQSVNAVFQNMQGKSLVSVRIVQAAAGGPFLFNWPANVRNGGEINPTNGSRNTQLLIPDTDGSLDGQQMSTTF
jgi:hypothetical protein